MVRSRTVDPSNSVQHRQLRTVILMERNKSRREGDLAFDEVTLDTEGRRPAEPLRVYPNRSMAFNLGEARRRSVSDSCRWCQLRHEKERGKKNKTKTNRSPGLQTRRKKRGRISDSHDGKLLQAPVTHTFSSALFPEEALQQQLITVVRSLLWCWSWYLMQISASAITPTANYWHLRGCLFELSWALIIQGSSEFWFAKTRRQEGNEEVEGTRDHKANVDTVMNCPNAIYYWKNIGVFFFLHIF